VTRSASPRSRLPLPPPRSPGGSLIRPPRPRDASHRAEEGPASMRPSGTRPVAPIVTSADLEDDGDDKPTVVPTGERNVPPLLCAAPSLNPPPSARPSIAPSRPASLPARNPALRAGPTTRSVAVPSIRRAPPRPAPPRPGPVPSFPVPAPLPHEPKAPVHAAPLPDDFDEDDEPTVARNVATLFTAPPLAASFDSASLANALPHVAVSNVDVDPVVDVDNPFAPCRRRRFLMLAIVFVAFFALGIAIRTARGDSYENDSPRAPLAQPLAVP